jgi:hypothetical protein
MSETTTEQTPASEQDFDFNGEFDPERAKGLIERLRDEVKALKSEQTPQDQKDAAVIASLKRRISEMEPKVKMVTDLENASKSELQRQAEALEEATRARDSALADATRYQVALQHGIGTEDLDLLGGGTQEEIAARAARIAELRTAATSAAQAPPAAPAPTPGQRPVEQLRPGATPSAAVSEDDANYARLFGTNAP